MDNLCSCTTTGYLGNVLLVCDKMNPNEFIVQGRAVGTPTVSSAQLIDQLQSFVLDQPPSIVYQEEAFTHVQRCSVELAALGETNCVHISEQSTTTQLDTLTEGPAVQVPYALIGGVAGGVVLLIVIVIIVAVVIWKKIGRGKSYRVEARNAVTVEM